MIAFAILILKIVVVRGAQPISIYTYNIYMRYIGKKSSFKNFILMTWKRFSAQECSFSKIAFPKTRRTRKPEYQSYLWGR